MSYDKLDKKDGAPQGKLFSEKWRTGRLATEIVPDINEGEKFQRFYHCLKVWKKKPHQMK